jgi:translocation and assembly module TamB
MKTKRLLFIGSFLLLVPLVFLFLTGTVAGLRTLIRMSNLLTAPLVSIGSASGSLFGTLHLRDVRYADGIDTVVIDLLDVSGSWAAGRGACTSYQSSRRRDPCAGESSGKTVLSPFSLPGRWSIDHVAAEALSFVSEQKEVWRIDTGFVNNLIYQGRSLNVEEFSFTNATIALQAKGQLLTNDDYPLHLLFDSHIRPHGFKPIHVRGSAEGALNALTIQADTLTPLSTHLDGLLNRLLGATTWQATFENPDVILKKNHEKWPEQCFAKVVMNGQGTLDAYTLYVRTQGGLPLLPDPSDLSVELQGNGDGIQISVLHLAQGKTELSAKGHLA